MLVSRWAGQSSARRRPCARSIVCGFPLISDVTIAVPLWWSWRRAPLSIEPCWRKWNDDSRASLGLDRRRPSPPALLAGLVSRHATSNKFTSRSPCTACRTAIRTSPAYRYSRMCSAAACPRGYFRRYVNSAASATRSMRSMPPIRTLVCSAFMPAPMPQMSPS